MLKFSASLIYLQPLKPLRFAKILKSVIKSLSFFLCCQVLGEISYNTILKFFFGESYALDKAPLYQCLYETLNYNWRIAQSVELERVKGGI